MFNLSLLVSSIVSTVAHVGALLVYPCPWQKKVYYVTGLCTSLLNHGTTSRIAQTLDRAFMLVAIQVDYLTLPVEVRPLVVASGLCYCASKVVLAYGLPREPLHILAHASITMAHVYGLAYNK